MEYDVYHTLVLVHGLHYKLYLLLQLLRAKHVVSSMSYRYVVQ